MLFLLQESEIPFAELFEIAKRLCDGSYTVIDKGAIRSVLRSLKMQTFIEKWLQIIHRIAKIRPPMPGKMLVWSLDEQFLGMQRPFELHRQEI
ncbi:MAG: hypothetical protein SGPRY_012985 [Prymnesium sp.]